MLMSADRILAHCGYALAATPSAASVGPAYPRSLLDLRIILNSIRTIKRWQILSKDLWIKVYHRGVYLLLVALVYYGVWRTYGIVSTARARESSISALRASLTEPVALLKQMDCINADAYSIQMIVAASLVEVLFRGLLLARLSHSIGGLPALIVSSVVFGLAHDTSIWSHRMQQSTVSGACFGAVYLLTRSLPLACALHSAHNAAVYYRDGRLNPMVTRTHIHTNGTH
jgi:membrane protease YdiL (CAAX protease family)